MVVTTVMVSGRVLLKRKVGCVNVCFISRNGGSQTTPKPARIGGAVRAVLTLSGSAAVSLKGHFERGEKEQE